MKLIPYGIADYKEIAENDYFFMDKTHKIPLLEKTGRYLMFLRPRRFGKSLLISYLAYYYDIFYKDAKLFENTFIGKNPTKEAHKYYVLRFNFSAVSIEDVNERFKFYVNINLKYFVEKYQFDIELNDNIKDNFEKILKYMKENKLPLYILIDEYDHFANRLLINDEESYKDMITDKTAFFKEFFTILKSATDSENSPLKRLFITGVTPMTMYDVTSGFNIGMNISLKKEFNDLVGFNEEEVDKILEYYKIDVDKTILKDWYNNYHFSPQVDYKIYNSDMILYFINNYEEQLPLEMIDINLRSDYSKLRYLIYTNKKLNGNFKTLQNLVAGEEISLTRIVQDFSALTLSEENNFKSLLFYLGLVTIKDFDFDYNLIIPNETIKRIDAEYIATSLKYENIFDINVADLARKFKSFALNGDIEIFSFLAEKIKNSTSIRDYIDRENNVKMMYVNYFSLVPYYITKTELELNKGFADLFIKPFYEKVKYFAIVEIKYINRSEKLKSQNLKQLKQEAIKQLEQYEKDELVTEWIKKGKKLIKIVMIFHGWELVEIEKV